MRWVTVALCAALGACTGAAEAPPRTYTVKLAKTTLNQLKGAFDRRAIGLIHRRILEFLTPTHPAAMVGDNVIARFRE